MSESAHSKYSASGFEAAMLCPGKPVLETGKPNPGSKYSRSGTASHTLLQQSIDTSMPAAAFIGNEIVADGELFMVDVERAGYVQTAIDNIHRMAGPDALILTEQQVNYAEALGVPGNEAWGTADVLVAKDAELQVHDYKDGQGVVVEAEDNPQLKMYALGVIRSLPPDTQSKIKTVHMTIGQVRLGHMPTFTMTHADLTHWAIHELRPKATLAFAGEGKTVAGEHCKFCKFKAQCRAQKEALLAEFDTHEDANKLTNDEIGDILNKADMFTDWLAAVKVHALSALNRGEAVKGWKLVEGRSIRVISDPEKAVDTLSSTLSVDPDMFYNKKIKGIGDLEKLVGKQRLALLLDGNIVKPAGAPTLAK